MRPEDEVIVVTGATGRQGGAVARALVADGWWVRGITRTPGSQVARALAARGVEVVGADMADSAAMRAACEGAHGVFSVQNDMSSGQQDELTQGVNVMDAAAEAGVTLVVQGSAGPGTGDTGVESWDVKVRIAEHARDRGLRLVVLRPMAFMELMTDKDLYPPVAAWGLMRAILGDDRPIPWLSAADVGAIAARAFADPDQYVGADLPLAADVRTLSECRETWRRVTGRNPRRIPMPTWLFQRFVGPDLVRMWRWLATHDVDAGPAQTRVHHPDAVTVEQFVRQRAAPTSR